MQMQDAGVEDHPPFGRIQVDLALCIGREVAQQWAGPMFPGWGPLACYAVDIWK
jgi:hypothetical protein